MLVIWSCSLSVQGSSASRCWMSASLCAFGDQERAEASVFGAGERPGEQDEAFVCERVHERGVVACAVAAR